MSILVERVDVLIRALENVKRRPQVAIGKIESKSLQRYLWGFREAAHIIDHRKYWEKHLNIVEQVAYDRGWPMNPAFVDAIRKKGLTEEEIIEEMLIIEIESWKRLAALIASKEESS